MEAIPNLEELHKASFKQLRAWSDSLQTNPEVLEIITPGGSGPDGWFPGYFLSADRCFAMATCRLLENAELTETRRIASLAAVLIKQAYQAQWDRFCATDGSYESMFALHRTLKCIAFGMNEEAEWLLQRMQSNIGVWVEEGRVQAVVLPACVAICTNAPRPVIESFIQQLRSQPDEIWNGYFDLFVELCQLLASNAPDAEVIAIGQRVLDGHPYQTYGEYGIFVGFPDDELVCWWLAGLLIHYKRFDAYRALANEPMLPESLLALHA